MLKDMHAVNWNSIREILNVKCGHHSNQIL